MASPPFTVSTITPGDSDIVSQYPLNERGTRDVLQSWITANHDTNGDHKWMKMPYQGSTPATPAASILTVYADVNGRLKIVLPDGTIHFVGVPPGALLFTAKTQGGGIPNGYLVADGSAVSRSTFADLFAEISTSFGTGDGSTTFNLPNISGRVIAGLDPTGARLTANTVSPGGNVMGAISGNNELITLVATQIPSITSSATVVSPNSTFLTAPATGFGLGSFSSVGGGAQVWQAFSAGAGLTQVLNITSTGTASSTNTGGLAHVNVQPTIVLRPLIKY